MPGTVVRDDDAPNLATGLTVNSATTTSTAAIEVNRPGRCTVAVKMPGTVGGTNPTFTGTLSQCETSGGTYTAVAQIPVTSGNAASQQNRELLLPVRVTQRYVKFSLTTGGTSPDYTGVTIRLEGPDYHFTKDYKAGGA